jgi:predicted DCC family thiol-disulfide oxidoreductase YuxK
MRDQQQAYLIYDGECPFCSAYVRFLRLKEAFGDIKLVDARTDAALVSDLKSKDFDLDEGMVLQIGDEVYHGADCIHVLSLMSGESGLFNRFNGWVFRSPARSRVLYPILRAGRNIALALLGRRKIHASQPTS